MVVYAHRGASAYAPENTIPAFHLAVRLGAPAVENDIHLTADGQIVVCHDDEISRTSNGKGCISQTTYAELRRYDFGSDDFPRARIPSLAEFLEATQPMKLINIELKSPLPVGLHLVLLLDSLYDALSFCGRIGSTIVVTTGPDDESNGIQLFAADCFMESFWTRRKPFGCLRNFMPTQSILTSIISRKRQ